MMKVSKTLAAALFLGGVVNSYAGTLPEGKFMFSTDISYTSARELWKGNNEAVSFQDAEGDTHSFDTTTRDGQTRFYNLGLNIGYGTPLWGIQADLRLDYTKSTMKDATHPNAANGLEEAQVNQLSGATLKLSKDIYQGSFYGLTGYLSYRHPIETKPEAPTFLAVNDFSTHITLGVKNSFALTSSLYTYLDLSYRMRSEAESLPNSDFPADQASAKLDLLYVHDETVSFGAGLVWLHTMAGPDISTSAFSSLAGTAGHPPFYAARERFLGRSVFFNYNLSSSSWIGISQFAKFYGRNTDISTTNTLYYGFTF